jgi:hypothetical protein
MERVWHGAPYVRPFLSLGTKRRLMFRNVGENIPFKIWNHPFTDRLGREFLTMNRSFDFGGIERRFDEFLTWGKERDRLIIYAGTHMHLAVDIEVAATAEGALLVSSNAQRLYEWKIGVPFPLFFAGRATVRQWYEEETERYHIDLAIRNPIWGPIFGYRGWYTGETKPCQPHDIDTDYLPMRVEPRE